MKALGPPAACAWAITWRASVVLREDSGPNTSITRPRGTPPTPSAASSEIEPVEITFTGNTFRDPSCWTEPLPNCFSICRRVCMMRRARSLDSMLGETSAQLVQGGKKSSQQFNGQVRFGRPVWNPESGTATHHHGGQDRWQATRKC